MLVLGILGMVYLPKSADTFSILFTIGVCGTFISLFYASVLAIGSCLTSGAPPEPILPLISKGVVAVK
jgi:hypothetical protein